jgi:UDP-glucose 4-epimerase
MAARRIVVTGASGNIGTALLRALAEQEPDTEVVGVCRRPPADRGGAEWVALDLTAPDAVSRLTAVLQGAAAVVHLAWAIQPVRDTDRLRRVDVGGTRTVLAAAAAAGVGQLVHASSVGVYAPGATAPVTEDWPDSGQRTTAYSRHKVAAERLLDRFAVDHPQVALARVRPAFVVQRVAGTEIRTLFLGPLVPRPLLALLRRGVLPVLPLPAGLALQLVHADDVADGVVRILDRRATGAFNLAADVLGPAELAALVGARPLLVPPAAARAVMGALFAAHAVPVSPGWFDLAMNAPLLDTTRARTELGWAPRHTSADAGRELLGGLAEGATGPSAALGAA